MAPKKSLLIRIKPEMWTALNRWARDEFRSLNGQIEFLLHKALSENKRLIKSDDRGDEQQEG